MLKVDESNVHQIGFQRELKASKDINIFKASIQLPENTGKIVAIQWDFEGEGTFNLNTVMDGIKSNFSIESTHI